MTKAIPKKIAVIKTVNVKVRPGRAFFAAPDER
jgi:hypothetical protein